MLRFLFEGFVKFEDTELKEHVNSEMLNSDLLHYKHILLSVLRTPMSGVQDLACILDNLTPLVQCMVKLEINELSLDQKHKLVLQCDNTVTMVSHTR